MANIGITIGFRLFVKIDLCSATSMESSRRDLLNDMAEHRSTLKNNQNTNYLRCIFTLKTGRSSLKQVSKSSAISTLCVVSSSRGVAYTKSDINTLQALKFLRCPVPTVQSREYCRVPRRLAACYTPTITRPRCGRRRAATKCPEGVARCGGRAHAMRRRVARARGLQRHETFLEGAGLS